MSSGQEFWHSVLNSSAPGPNSRVEKQMFGVEKVDMPCWHPWIPNIDSLNLNLIILSHQQTSALFYLYFLGLPLNAQIKHCNNSDTLQCKRHSTLLKGKVSIRMINIRSNLCTISREGSTKNDDKCFLVHNCLQRQKLVLFFKKPMALTLPCENLDSPPIKILTQNHSWTLMRSSSSQAKKLHKNCLQKQNLMTPNQLYRLIESHEILLL